MIKGATNKENKGETGKTIGNLLDTYWLLSLMFKDSLQTGRKKDNSLEK